MMQTLPQLPKEVWTCIASHLRQPFPQPRDVKERREIRQVDLVSLMRTSKLLNNATAPALYSLVITDDIAGLYHNFCSPHPVAPGILSKRELLRLTRALFLEFPTRPLSKIQQDNMIKFDLDNPLAQLGGFDNFDRVFFGGLTFHSDPALATLIDAEMILAAKPATRLPVAMPGLEILSCATFFGSYEDGWTSSFGGTGGYMTRVGHIQTLFTRMVLDSKIQHFCQTGNMNPLAIHPLELHKYSPIAPPPLRSITLHVDLQKQKPTDYDDYFSSSSCIPGVRVRWCFDQPRRTRSISTPQPFLDFPDQPPFAMSIMYSMASGLAMRHEKRDAHKGPGAYPVVPFTVDVYIPMTDATAKLLLKDITVRNPGGSSAKEKVNYRRRAAAERLGMALETELFRTDVETKLVHPDDHLGVHYVADCPACPVCGWLAKV